MDREQARLFRDRWKKVEELEREELRALTDADRLRQFFAILGMAQALGLRKDPVDDTAIWDRWRRLQEHYGRSARA